MKTLLRLAILKRWSSAKKSVTVRLGQYIINGPDYHVISTLLKEKFVDEEYYFSSDDVRPVVIDGGANIGISVLYFKCLYPDCEIHCFEPYDVAYSYLEKNVRDNKFRNVSLHREAIGSEEWRLSLFIPGDNIINASVIETGAMPSIVVQSISLSAFLQQFDRIDLVKLDVEGAESEIIGDLYNSGLLATGRVKRFIIEYHTAMNGSEQHFCEMFTTCGYMVTTKVLFPANSQSDVLITAEVG